MAFVYIFLNSYSRGYSDGNFFKNFTAMDTATARRGYSDGQAWIQRWLGVDTATAFRGTFPRQIRGCRYCDEKVATAKKTLRRGNIHAYPWILPRFCRGKIDHLY